MVWIGCPKFTCKERLFCALSWIPKATVQAALAPLVVSFVQAKTPGDPAYEKHAEIVVTIAVLAILITAPLGSVLIALTGPKLLQLPNESTVDPLDQEFPHGEEESKVEYHTKSRVTFDENDSPPLEMSGSVIQSNLASNMDSYTSSAAVLHAEVYQAEPPKKSETKKNYSKKVGGSIMDNL